MQLLDTEHKNTQLESDIEILSKLASEAGGSLDTAQNDLQNISDELAQLYHHVCTVNGETPSRVVLDHEKIIPDKDEENSGKIEWFRTLSKTDLSIKDLEGLSKAKEISKHIETAMDQIKHLRNAVEHTIDLSKLKGNQGNVANDSECEYSSLIRQWGIYLANISLILVSVIGTKKIAPSMPLTVRELVPLPYL